MNTLGSLSLIKDTHPTYIQCACATNIFCKGIISFMIDGISIDFDCPLDH